MKEFFILFLTSFTGSFFFSYFMIKLITRKKCEGSNLIDGCGKSIYLVNRYGSLEAIYAFLKISKKVKSETDFYKKFTIFRHAQYERVYCCLKCYDKHESIRVANVLAGEVDENEDSYTLIYGKK